MKSVLVRVCFLQRKRQRQELISSPCSTDFLIASKRKGN